MNRECGFIKGKIWLIGDSEPRNYSDELQNPFDLKHPTVHNIFTPILEQIQDDIFHTGNRVDWNKFYIRNAMKNVSDWKDESVLNKEILNLRHLVSDYLPIIIIPFGTRAFEFVRRALSEESRGLESWDTIEMGKEFIRRCQGFDVSKTNIIPLLHACICRGKYLVAHKNFCTSIGSTNEIVEDNYFIATGKIISPLLINNKRSFNCWKVSS